MKPAAPSPDVIIALLVRAGMKRILAKFITHLAKNKQADVLAIQRGANLRQPDISRAARMAEKKGWITTERGMGALDRPVNIYKLAVSLEKILEEVEEAARENREVQQARIERARRMAR